MNMRASPGHKSVGRLGTTMENLRDYYVITIINCVIATLSETLPETHS